MRRLTSQAEAIAPARFAALALPCAPLALSCATLMFSCATIMFSCAALLLPGVASAQDQMLPRAPAVFLERAYFSLGTPTGKSLAFEGQPTVHFFFANGLGNAVWQKNGGFTWA